MTLRYLTAGESHGKGLTAILEGLPSRIPLLKEDIDVQLKRRMQGYGRGGRMKIEADEVEILSGVRHGETLGSPIALWIENKDFRAWSEEMASEPRPDFDSKKAIVEPRPGHADLAGGIKYAHRDLRNVLERASARETTARVAVGAVCRKFLSLFGIEVTGHVTNIGGIAIPDERPDPAVIAQRQEADPCRCIDPEVSARMREKIDQAKKNGDTVGGIIEVIFTGLPMGLGSHVHWDRKLDARLAATMLSIQAIKGVEFGLGFACAGRFGSQVHDPIHYAPQAKRFYHGRNNAGGLVGGMTDGEPLVIRGVMKPISTLYTPLDSVNIETKASFKAAIERSDTCAVPAACVIAENALCFDVAQAISEKFGGDSIEEALRNFKAYQDSVREY